MDLTSGQVARVEKVKNFQVPEDGSGFIAYLLESKPEPKKPEAAKEGEGAAPAPAAGEGASRPSGRNSKKKEYGSDLILRNTATGSERAFADVLDYSLSKDAKTLVYSVSSKSEDTNGVYLVTPHRPFWNRSRGMMGRRIRAANHAVAKQRDSRGRPISPDSAKTVVSDKASLGFA
jgi:hypothetical protein